ncbi:MAG: hypothetical protein JSR67_03800 [Proteobacteria bacterium]|nr:hypothetical protein [Pseudomonadota bacterium]
MQTATVDGRSYAVTTLDTPDLTRADLLRRGWDGNFYQLTGKRGAVHLAMRNSATGRFLKATAVRL